MILPQFRRGEVLRAADLQTLVDLARQIRASQLRPAPGVLLAQQIDGTAATVKARAVLGIDHPFRFTVIEEDDTLLLRFATPGHVAGIEPLIDGEPAFKPLADGQWPALKIPPASFEPGRKRCLVYLRYTLDAALAVTRVDVEAHPKKPAGSPQVFWKLLAILQRGDAGLRVFPQCFFSQGWGAVPGGGKFPYAEA